MKSVLISDENLNVPDFAQAQKLHAEVIMSLVRNYFEKKQQEGETLTLDECLRAVDVSFEEFNWAQGYLVRHNNK